MTYEQARAFIETTKQYGSVPGLENITNLMEALFGEDWQKTLSELPCIHVAGTNGKGSVCAFLSAALTQNGYKVGRYHSPAVFSEREIYRIGEEVIGEEDYAELMEKVKQACELLVLAGKPHPTSFEAETAAAFLYFYRQRCDMVLLEVGMGGALDATNVISSPICSVITSIGMDHMRFLGDTLTEIAKQKAGIIKEGCPVVTTVQKPEVTQVLRDVAKEKKAEFYCSEWEKVPCEQTDTTLVLYHPHYGRLETTLNANYQRENLMLAAKTLEVLEQEGYALEKERVRAGVKKARWQGRFECVCHAPTLILDGAHNPAAAIQLAASIQKHFTNRKIIYIIGVLADKDSSQMLRTLIPLAQSAYTVTPDNPRALSAELLAKQITGKIKVSAKTSIAEALDSAITEAKEQNAVIVAWGSLSYLGELKLALSEIISEREEESTGKIHGRE